MSLSIRQLVRISLPLLGALLAITFAGFLLMPRTTHAQPVEVKPTHRFTNRLAEESSPYLLQHAHNPVDWYPWGPEAFQSARERGVPIFLSVGYATCYWCHVMERESFENEQTAAYLNSHFVAIKVDREERPEVDDLYMTATQLMTGSGGWPMTVFLTPPGATGESDPGLKPFYAGTYFPSEARPGLPSLMQALAGIADAWNKQRDAVLKQSEQVAGAVHERLADKNEPVRVGREQVDQAVDILLRIFDKTNGGFGGAPKFPQPVYLELLLDERDRLAKKTGRDDASVGQRQSEIDTALDKTLDAMALGGVFDQVGGGFHRYSTDESWTVPHFEKMLYDQAQLLHVYARRFAQTRNMLCKRVALQTAHYVLREMTNEQGGFFAAQDAEVDGHEGRNYVWTKAQVDAALPDGDDAAFASRIFGVDDGSNFRDPHHPESAAANVLRLSAGPETLASSMDLSTTAFYVKLDHVRGALLASRAQRKQPRTDDKSVAAWNGMMVMALADASTLLEEPALLDAASRTGEFLWTKMRDETGALRRTWRDASQGPLATLADYAQVARGFVAIARARKARDANDTNDDATATALERARALLQSMDARFGADDGGWYDIEAGRDDLFVRLRATYDGAVPSGASAALHALLDYADAADDPSMRERAGRGLRALSDVIAQAPASPIDSVRALARLLDADAHAGAQLAGLPALPVKPGASLPEQLLDKARDAVHIFASQERATVKAGDAVTLTIMLRIAQGFHVTAHDPGAAGLSGLDVRVVGGTGVRAIVSYPEGKELDVVIAGAEGAGTPHVYTGETTINVELVRTGEPVTGEARLEVSYQVCTDQVCLAPVTATLGVEIEVK